MSWAGSWGSGFMGWGGEIAAVRRAGTSKRKRRLRVFRSMQAEDEVLQPTIPSPVEIVGDNDEEILMLALTRILH